MYRYFIDFTETIVLLFPSGTPVMRIMAHDDDEAGTVNSNISYSILAQEPAGAGHMFYINQWTGDLYVNDPTLDREVKQLLPAHHSP